MKRILRPVFATTALWLAVSGVHAAGESPPAAHATSVTEMLQGKEEARLREQLVKEGRWDEVRALEQAQANRLEAQKKKTLTRINGKLAANAPGDSPAIDSMGTLCTPLRAGISTGARGFGSDQDTMLVR